MISISASELTLKTSFLTLDKSSFALKASCFTLKTSHLAPRLPVQKREFHPRKQEKTLKTKATTRSFGMLLLFKFYEQEVPPDLGQWATQNRQREKRRDGARAASVLRRV